MKRDMIFLQSLQESFAAWTGLTIMICDLEGELQTKITWESPKSEEQFSKHITKDNLANFLSDFQLLHQTIVLDTKFGIKIIISPIKTKVFQQNYFIIAGAIIERQTDEVLANYLEADDALAFIDVSLGLAPNEIQKKVEQIDNMKSTISSYFLMLEENELVNKVSKFLVEKMSLVNNGIATFESILEMGSLFEEVDFMGVALSSKENHYIVEAMIGDYSDQFIGYEFRIGEGVLGYSIATQKPLFNENLTKDARRTLFSTRNMNVISIFCFPIINEEKVIGLLFGGSAESSIKKTTLLYDSLSACATVLNNHLLKMELQTANRLLRNETEMLSDILEAFPISRNIKKTLYLIIDIGMNTMNFEFISVVIKNVNKVNRLEVLSKGLSEQEVQDYCSQLMARIEQTPSDNEELKLSLTSWGTHVAEVPITMDGVKYGILSVGIRDAEDIKRFTNAIAGLSLAAGIALQFNREAKTKTNKKRTVDWIRVVLQNFNPEKLKLAQDIMNSVSSFLPEKGITPLSIVEEIVLLGVCDRDILNKIVEDKELFNLMNDFYNALDNKSGGDYLIETIAVVWTYFVNGESLDSVSKLELVHDDIKLHFASFLKRQETSHLSFSLNEDDIHVRHIEAFGLTKREEEVLKEMMKGIGNKEIADTLFISEHTVKNHVTNILRKLEVADRSHAIAKVYKMGIKD